MCEIANKIKSRRIQLGLTLEEVAQAVGVGRSTVLRWESGQIRNMGRDKIAKLAAILQISPVELVPAEKVYEDETGIYVAVPAVNAEDQERLEALHQDPRLGLLFDRTRKMSRADVETMLAVAASILKERDGE